MKYSLPLLTTSKTPIPSSHLNSNKVHIPKVANPNSTNALAKPLRKRSSPLRLTAGDPAAPLVLATAATTVRPGEEGEEEEEEDVHDMVDGIEDLDILNDEDLREEELDALNEELDLDYDPDDPDGDEMSVSDDDKENADDFVIPDNAEPEAVPEQPSCSVCFEDIDPLHVKACENCGSLIPLPHSRPQVSSE